MPHRRNHGARNRAAHREHSPYLARHHCAIGAGGGTPGLWGGLDLRAPAVPDRSGRATGRPAASAVGGLQGCLDPLETLAYVAAQTERIKLGTSVVDALFRVPVVLARRYATLDQFSNGRVIAGLGQGWMEQEFATANVSPKRRGAGLDEFIAAMRAA